MAITPIRRAKYEAEELQQQNPDAMNLEWESSFPAALADVKIEKTVVWDCAAGRYDEELSHSFEDSGDFLIYVNLLQGTPPRTREETARVNAEATERFMTETGIAKRERASRALEAIMGTTRVEFDIDAFIRPLKPTFRTRVTAWLEYLHLRLRLAGREKQLGYDPVRFILCIPGRVTLTVVRTHTSLGGDIMPFPEPRRGPEHYKEITAQAPQDTVFNLRMEDKRERLAQYESELER